MGSLVLLRHGQSEWNLENRFTGWVDIPLTDTGRAEAEQAGKRIAHAGIHLQRAFTSVLIRAIESAQICLRAAGQETVPLTKDQALNERHYGDLQGLNKAETAKKYGDEQVQLWRRSYDVNPPNGESLKDTAGRTLPYCESFILPGVCAGESALVCAHGNSLRSLVMLLEHLSPQEVVQVEIPTGEPIVYELGGGGEVQSTRTL